MRGKILSHFRFSACMFHQYHFSAFVLNISKIFLLYSPFINHKTLDNILVNLAIVSFLSKTQVIELDFLISMKSQFYFSHSTNDAFLKTR